MESDLQPNFSRFVYHRRTTGEEQVAHYGEQGSGRNESDSQELSTTRVRNDLLTEIYHRKVIILILGG
jgi:hypothetical protein